MQGKRVDDPPGPFEPGEYGKVGGVWHGRAPRNANGIALTANLSRHEVVEHEDGTITVSPSILVSAGDAGSWHGYLELGVWREC